MNEGASVSQKRGCVNEIGGKIKEGHISPKNALVQFFLYVLFKKQSILKERIV